MTTTGVIQITITRIIYSHARNINLITRFQVGTSRKVLGTPKVYSSGLGIGDVAGIPEEGSDAECGAGLTSRPSVDSDSGAAG